MTQCESDSPSSPVGTTTSIILCFNKQWLTQLHLENRRSNGDREGGARKDIEEAADGLFALRFFACQLLEQRLFDWLIRVTPERLVLPTSYCHLGQSPPLRLPAHTHTHAHTLVHILNYRKTVANVIFEQKSLKPETGVICDKFS